LTRVREIWNAVGPGIQRSPGAIQSLLSHPEDPKIIAVDFPIGLPEVTLPGARTCERLARSEANDGIGIGAQAWVLAKKLSVVDALMIPARQELIREVHPELSFAEMTGSPAAWL
jgi:predicted RNase H-like nuclease